MDRNAWLLKDLNLERAKGIEIGALDKPLIPPSSPGVFYVDHATTEELRAKYATDESVVLENLVQVSGVWGAQSLAEITAEAGPFDFLVASHVIEHVPDLITWLHELSSVLRPDGQVRLAIPDRRYTFDYLRSETEVADVLAAWLHKDRRPAVRQIIDFALHFAHNDCGKAWEQGFTGADLVPAYTSEHAIRLARDAMRDGLYHDVHCWVFTPVSFAKLMAKLGSYGVIPFKCLDFRDSVHWTYEFLVALQKSADRAEIVASWSSMAATLEQKLVTLKERLQTERDASRVEELIAAERQACAAELAAAEAQNTQLAIQVAELKAQVADRTSHVSALLGSTSWRVTAPLRALRRLVRT